MRADPVVPVGVSTEARNATHFKTSPHCIPDFSFPPTFNACQAKTWEERQTALVFSLSPSMERYIYNHTNENSTTGTGWSWYQWLLSNEVGAVADVSALVQLLPITTQLLKVSGVVSEQRGRERRLRIGQEEKLYNHTLPGASVAIAP